MQIKQRLPKENAREYAFRMLQENIVMIELEPGALVSEQELASELGLSRTPVREALIELRKLHIVEIYPQRGCFISKIDYEMIAEIRFFRLVLEKAIVELACEIHHQLDLASLRENIALQEFYLKNFSAEKLHKLDGQFHKRLFDLCGKSNIYQIMKGLTTHDDRLRNLSLRARANVRIVEEHKNLLEAIRQGDASQAVEIITRHLTKYKSEEEQLRQEHPEYFL